MDQRGDHRGFGKTSPAWDLCGRIALLTPQGSTFPHADAIRARIVGCQGSNGREPQPVREVIIR